MVSEDWVGDAFSAEIHLYGNSDLRAELAFSKSTGRGLGLIQL